MIQPPVTSTPEALVRLRARHQAEPGYGNMSTRFLPLVAGFCEELKARSALDFACGKGSLGRALAAKGLKVHLYEIGVEAFAEPLAAPVDVAICNHALYEMPHTALLATLDYLKAVSTRGVFLSMQFALGARHGATGDIAQGATHWNGPIQDYDWVAATFRQLWPCHVLMDSGPHERLQRQLIFKGYAERAKWI